jgi:ppGpp synthetase/RelA/SpoT-type nucleotidyltranferase
VTAEDVQRWLDEHDTVLERAKSELERRVKSFVEDWSTNWGFEYESIEPARIKSASRTFAKAERKEVGEAGKLLERCREKEGRMRFPVHDLLGIRIFVLSLNDVRKLRQAIEDHLAGGDEDSYPLGKLEDVDLQDFNENPPERGYRALHLDGSVSVKVQGQAYDVPFELQVKTLAQHVFGQHTHNDAYVPDDRNTDPRYDSVRGLQRALAEALNGADLLLAKIQEVSGVIRDEIAAHHVGPDLDAAAVTAAVRNLYGEVVRDEEAQRWADRSRDAGITRTEDFEALIDPSGDEAARVATNFLRFNRRAPAYRELIDDLLSEALELSDGMPSLTGDDSD